MRDMTLDELIASLKPLTMKQRARVAELGGCPFWTAQKMAVGQTRDPLLSTFLAVQRGWLAYQAEQAAEHTVAEH